MEDSQNATPNPSSDILIAVMGVTGSGKSQFISHCTGETLSIGSTLQSREFLLLTMIHSNAPRDLTSSEDTQTVRAYRCNIPNLEAVCLIDTPGFDDTSRQDTEILREIAAWVTMAYKQRVQLRGILYLHRITDCRMQGAAMRNLFMFKKLCGRNALKNVILATTMWDYDQPPKGEEREEELKSTHEFWGE
jgi:predicted GTPase